LLLTQLIPEPGNRPVNRGYAVGNQISLQAIIHGHVQGVFFRAYILTRATELGLLGYVRNMPSGQDVEVHAEGERDKLERLLKYLEVGPPAGRVEKVSVKWNQPTGEYNRFSARS
jgi:acylphosphatase